MQSSITDTIPRSLILPIEDELKLDTGKTYAFDLDDISLIRFSGDKASEFIQGQVTCDVRRLKEHEVLRGAMCNLKGRILALFQLVRSQELCMLLPENMREKTISSLNKIAMLSRVKIEKADTWSIIGLYHQDMPHPELPNEDYQAYKLEEDLSLLIIKKSEKSELCAWYQQKQQLRGSLAWHALNLYRKHIDIYPETAESFLPHRLDLHQNGYIHFDKGCYKGQEIIARTQYKATLKHELCLFQTREPVHCLQKIMNPEKTKELGEIVDFSPVADGFYLCAATLLKERPEQGWIEGHNELIFF